MSVEVGTGVLDIRDCLVDSAISRGAATKEIMFHTERDSAVFMAEMLLGLGILVSAVYALAILIALVLKAFRSPATLYTSFLLSTIASIPLLFALILQWPYLPREWDINPGAGLLSLLDGVLLSFVWAAPAVQYRFVRRKTRAAFQQAPPKELPSADSERRVDWKHRC